MDIYRCRYKSASGERETRELTPSHAKNVCRIAKRHNMPCSCRKVRVAKGIKAMPAY